MPSNNFPALFGRPIKSQQQLEIEILRKEAKKKKTSQEKIEKKKMKVIQDYKDIFIILKNYIKKELIQRIK